MARRKKLARKPEKVMSDLEEKELKCQLIAHMPRSAEHERYLYRYVLVRTSRGRPPDYKPGDYYKRKMAEFQARKVRMDTLMQLRRSSSARCRGGLKIAVAVPQAQLAQMVQADGHALIFSILLLRPACLFSVGMASSGRPLGATTVRKKRRASVAVCALQYCK
ncbi:hypothetical protein B0H10DRAFT_1961530 [Mycena sp. CBHHK59/15]|nr:hypothetical protein B0H10DRAFT_1961530 [Mycena sp. CBHHK59/15]